MTEEKRKRSGYARGYVSEKQKKTTLMPDRPVLCSEGIIMDENYCISPDRRFQIEHEYGLGPPGREYLTNEEPPPRFIPERCYDVVGGFYDPESKVVYEYPVIKKTTRNAQQIRSSKNNKSDNDDPFSKGKRTVCWLPTPLQEEWIIANCRRPWNEPIGYTSDLYGEWTTGTFKHQSYSEHRHHGRLVEELGLLDKNTKTKRVLSFISDNIELKKKIEESFCHPTSSVLYIRKTSTHDSKMQRELGKQSYLGKSQHSKGTYVEYEKCMLKAKKINEYYPVRRKDVDENNLMKLHTPEKSKKLERDNMIIESIDSTKIYTKHVIDRCAAVSSAQERAVYQDHPDIVYHLRDKNYQKVLNLQTNSTFKNQKNCNERPRETQEDHNLKHDKNKLQHVDTYGEVTDKDMNRVFVEYKKLQAVLIELKNSLHIAGLYGKSGNHQLLLQEIKDKIRKANKMMEFPDASGIPKQEDNFQIEKSVGSPPLYSLKIEGTN